LDRNIHITPITGIIKRNFVYLDKHSFVLLCKAMVRLHLEYANSVWAPYKRDIQIEIIEKVQKRVTKLIISLKHLYTDRLKQLMLPTLKYWHLSRDMIEIFKTVLNFYHLEAAVKLSFNTFSYFSTTRGNKYKLQKSSCQYNIRKYSFSSRVVNMSNSLPNDVVEADTINTFKYCSV